jgi:hypothetical protein
VIYRVFYEGLQKKAWDHCLLNLSCDLKIYLEAVSESHLLQCYVSPSQLDFFSKGALRL